MTRTYYIEHDVLGEKRFDKVVHKSIENRPRWHKVEALSIWKKSHKGYGYLRIDKVHTKEEFEEVTK